MSDFFLDFRAQAGQSVCPMVASQLKYYDDMTVFRWAGSAFSLVLTRADDIHLWGPLESPDKQILIALCGRIALESSEWEAAARESGPGGVACKAIFRMYRAGGIQALEQLNGNFVVIVHDASEKKMFLVVDRCGMVPCFIAERQDQGLVISSQPDVLAASVGESQSWDHTSMAQFLMTGMVTFPYTYYSRIKALDYGSVHTIDLSQGAARYEGRKKFFPFDFQLDSHASPQSLAAALASAFQNAMRKRTLPLFGRTALAMSGGLDSRALLCAVAERDHLVTFCFFDEENLEYKFARAIARAAQVELVPLRRDFDHYGGAAEMGVRIFGGMGGFFNNHFLGFRETFKQLGFDNLITGFYCDYYFKALALDRTKNRWTQLEDLADYQHQWYRPCFWIQGPLLERVYERLEELIPLQLQRDRSERARLEISRRRVFPLCYEPDHAETTIPQRVMPWYLPTVDNDILDAFLRIPPRWKLNAWMYSKMVAMLCGKRISRIPNINTGAPVDAPRASLVFHKYLNAVRNRFEKRIKPSLALSGSWPNWEYYVHNSQKIHSLWEREKPLARNFFKEILGCDPYERPIQAYRGQEVDFFSRLLTLKLWLEQRQ